MCGLVRSIGCAMCSPLVAPRPPPPTDHSEEPLGRSRWRGRMLKFRRTFGRSPSAALTRTGPR
eukprot:scaffold270800_cov27-Tisochrysis_lutea.AAC.1